MWLVSERLLTFVDNSRFLFTFCSFVPACGPTGPTSVLCPVNNKFSRAMQSGCTRSYPRPWQLFSLRYRSSRRSRWWWPWTRALAPTLSIGSVRICGSTWRLACIRQAAVPAAQSCHLLGSSRSVVYHVSHETWIMADCRQEDSKVPIETILALSD